MMKTSTMILCNSKKLRILSSCSSWGAVLALTSWWQQRQHNYWKSGDSGTNEGEDVVSSSCIYESIPASNVILLFHLIVR